MLNYQRVPNFESQNERIIARSVQGQSIHVFFLVHSPNWKFLKGRGIILKGNTKMIFCMWRVFHGLSPILGKLQLKLKLRSKSITEMILFPLLVDE